MNDRIKYVSVAALVIVGLLIAAYIWLGKPPADDSQERLIQVKGTVYTPERELLADAKVWVFPPAVEVRTDSAGVFAVSCEASSERRLLYVRDKERELIGSALLPADGGQVEVKLKFAESVKGRVVDPEGRPVSGAHVGAVPMSDRYVLTDTDGGFDIAWGLDWYEPGMEIYLFVRHVGRNLAALAPIPEYRTVDVRIVAEPALTLMGTVVDIEQRPICGARVATGLVKDWSCGTPVEVVITDDKGCYEIPALPQRQGYRIFAAAEGYEQGRFYTGVFNNKRSTVQIDEIILKDVEISTPEQVPDVEGKAKAEMGETHKKGQITGSVRNIEGNVVEGVEVQVVPAGTMGDRAFTDEEGKYRASWNPEFKPYGLKTLCAVARDVDRNLATAAEFDESDSTADIELQPGVIIVGKVVDSNGNPIKGAMFYPFIQYGSTDYRIAYGAFYTDSNGRLELPAMPHSRLYRIHVRCDGYSQADVAVVAPAASRSNQIDLGKVVLKTADRQIAGRVTDVDNRSVSNAEVTSGSPAYSVTRTDPNGQFVLKGLPPGNVRIGAMSRQGGDNLFGYVEAKAGDEQVHVVISSLGKLSQEWTQESKSSLLGRTLPSLSDVDFGACHGPLGEHWTVICFWDWSQRPSRNAVIELNKSFRDTNRGVRLLTIELSGASFEQIGEWTKRNDIRLNIGRVSTDAEAIRKAFDIGGLPQFLLVNEGRIVVAATSSVSELRLKLRSVSLADF